MNSQRRFFRTPGSTAGARISEEAAKEYAKKAAANPPQPPSLDLSSNSTEQKNQRRISIEEESPRVDSWLKPPGKL